MPKISALTPIISPAADDESPIVDESVSQTKKITLSQLQTYLESLAAWVDKGMIDFGDGIWWEELARATWASGSQLSSGAFTAKKYLKVILVYTDSTSASGVDLQFNGDTGNNYCYRRYLNGGETTGTSADRIEIAGNYKGPALCEVDIINIAAVPKPMWGKWSAMPTAGAANPPALGMYAQRWVNSAAQITSILADHRGTNMTTASEMIILGHD